jgi:hypothetical protein
MQQALRDHVETAALNGGLALVRPPPSPGTSGAPDFGALAATGADSVLETTLLSAGTTGSGINAPVMVYMTARARLLRVGGGKEILSADYTYVGRKLTLAGWSANDAAALLKELESGYDALGGHIFESVFQLYPLPDSSSHPAGILSTAVGLAPIHPPNRGQLTGDIVMGNLFEWTTVDSLRPTLRWQAFPRPSDIAKAPGDMGRVRNVRYDLVIAREENLAPADIVYRGDALASPEQALPISLRPRTRYFWTVRARFELDGRERVTEWASTNYWIREQVTAPSIFSYRFKTP